MTELRPVPSREPEPGELLGLLVARLREIDARHDRALMKRRVERGLQRAGYSARVSRRLADLCVAALVDSE